MHKTLVVALREYRSSVQTKSFLISLLFLPLLMGISILLQNLGETQEKHFIILDRTEGKQILPWVLFFYKNHEEIQLPVFGLRGKRLPFDVDVKEYHPATQDLNEQRYELSQMIRKGEINGFAEIGPRKKLFADSLNNRKPEQLAIRYQTNSPSYNTFPSWLVQAVNYAKPEVDLGNAPTKENWEALKSSFQPIELVTKGLSQRNAAGQVEEAATENRVAPLLVPIGLTMLMFLVIMVGTTPLIQGVIEEKMQRIAEVLLGSISPFGLMMGKLLGMVGVALTLTAVYLGGAYWLVNYFGYAAYLPADLIGWFLVFVVMAVFMYGSIFIAIGAACSEMKEAQTLLMPVMLVAMIPMFVMTNVINEPNGPLAFWLSFFPTGTPMLMVARQAIPPHLPLWQPLLGVALVLATTVLCVYAAGRIFRVGILMQGKGARFSDLVRWAIRG